jgi:TonB family protein
MKALACVAVCLVLAVASGSAAEDKLDQQPVPKFQKPPVYPYALSARGNSGEVMIDFVVDAHGDVWNPIVLKSTHPEFEAPAVEALLEWKFNPGLKDGRPVDTHMQVPIIFEVSRNGTPGVSPFVAPRKPPKETPPEFQYDEPPRAMLTTAPVYPIELLEQKITGSAMIHFLVDPTGQPREITVHEATRPEFGAAAAAMIAAWRFEPAKKNGKASWALLGKKQVFNRSDRDSPVNGSAERLLKAQQKDPSSIAGGFAELDARPKPRFQPGPIVPAALLKDNVAAEAEIEFIIDRVGHAQLPRIVSATRDDFGWAAATAVARWQFSLPTKGGKPVDVRIRVPLGYEPPAKKAP